MAKLYNEFKEDGFVILAISTGEKKEIVKEFAEKKKLPFPVLTDTDGAVAKQYGVRAHPDHFFIDRRGIIIGRALGGKNWAAVEVRNLIRSLLQES